MPKSGLNVALKGLDDIFSTEESRQEEQREQVQQIPVSELFPFKNHPFKVLDDDSMTRTVESISQFGVLAPLIARPRPEGGYEIISGHRRKHAAELANLDTVPVIVRNMEDDAATILMVDSNLQREHILPSERAFAYKMKLDAIKNQGARSDLTSSQVGTKLRADEKVAKDSGESRNQVQRFVRLTNLVPELLDMVDEKKISFNPAVELSYLDEKQQQDFLEAMDASQNAPSLSQAIRIKKLAQQGEFDYDAVYNIMNEEKKSELDTVTIKNETLHLRRGPALLQSFCQTVGAGGLAAGRRAGEHDDLCAGKLHFLGGVIYPLGIALLTQVGKCLWAAGCHIVQIDLNQTFGYPNRDHKNQPLLFCVPAPPQNAGYIRSDI